jgi:hypothetical protein
MTKQRLWLALLVLIASLSCSISCSKQILLPPETQTGAGTFACLINGQVWTYKDPTEFFTLKPATYWEYDPKVKGGRLLMDGLRYDDDSKLIDRTGLSVDSLLFKKEIILDSNIEPEGIGVCYRKGQTSDCNDYCPSLNLKIFPYRQGKITITKFDQQLRIIAGKFYCTILKSGCDTLKITEGRFDIKF